MRDFAGKKAVITGGGTGMGRELARQLVAQGCDVAMCDVSAANLAESRRICEQQAPQGIRVSTSICDVADPEQMDAFAEHVRDALSTGHINLLFNNAGIAGAGSFLEDDRKLWERTFNICWGGVYNGSRSFMPLLVNSDEGHIINTSSINGFWASSGIQSPHTAYSAAKFAVKGFTEALITDLRLHAPHVKASVVMPGHVGTSILLNSQAAAQADTSSAADQAVGTDRTLLRMMNTDTRTMSDADVEVAIRGVGAAFRDNAPTTAREAADIILQGVKNGQWRILVGQDAVMLDELVRAAPAEAYQAEFLQRWSTARADL